MTRASYQAELIRLLSRATTVTKMSQILEYADEHLSELAYTPAERASFFDQLLDLAKFDRTALLNPELPEAIVEHCHASQT